MSNNATSINTAKADGFRKLRFQSIDEVIEEIDRITAEAQSDRLETLGNWSIGQIFSHLAAWIEYGYTGYPMGKPPWIVRFILGFMVKKYLRDGMPRGVRIPGTKEGTFGQDNASLEESAARLKRAFSRLQKGEPCSYDSPAFGVMSHEDRIRLNLRHAELHLGYVRY